MVDFSELEGLPEPVQRYFRTVLEDGRPIVRQVRLWHSGTFNMSETSEQWRPFTSEQWVVTSRPGFIWNGRIAMFPGLPVRVHDAYVAGEGILHASLFGLATVASVRGTREMAEGELMRYLAEATWYPTALLPGQGVVWKAVDDKSALGSLTDGDVTIELLFTFDDQGYVTEVRADGRGRTVGSEVVQTPWLGRFWNYEQRNGMLVPVDGEVAWRLPQGEKSYWRGHVVELNYEFAR